MIVGITGKARAGKSTIAAHLLSQGFQEISFAAPIRMFACHMLNCTLQDLEKIKETPQKLFGGHTPRHFMQQLGTEFGRSINPTIWVDYCLNNLSYDLDYVISDVRFKNEAEAITKEGGVIIHVVRDGVHTQSAGHASEQGIPQEYITNTIHNNGDIEELKRKVDALL